jgi:hypothetical protein
MGAAFARRSGNGSRPAGDSAPTGRTHPSQHLVKHYRLRTTDTARALRRQTQALISTSEQKPTVNMTHSPKKPGDHSPFIPVSGCGRKILT